MTMEDEFAALRALCAKAGVFIPEAGGISTMSSWTLLRIINAVAERVADPLDASSDMPYGRNST